MISLFLAASSVSELLGGRETLSVSLRIVAIMTVLTVLPSVVLMTTSFVRVVIVLSFIRKALGTQQLPPNQVIIGLSLFLTFMIMTPTWTTVWNEAIRPYLDYEIKDEKVAVEKALTPLRGFMLKQIDQKDLAMFIKITRKKVSPNMKIKLSDVSTPVIVSAFMTSELKRAFKMGFLLYLPFVVIDLIVASVLISMGMLVLPPILISLPFKILIFVLVDGWGLIVGKLVESFAGG